MGGFIMKWISKRLYDKIVMSETGIEWSNYRLLEALQIKNACTWEAFKSLRLTWS